MPRTPHPSVRKAARAAQFEAELLVDAPPPLGDKVAGDPLVAAVGWRSSHGVLLTHAQLDGLLHKLAERRKPLPRAYAQEPPLRHKAPLLPLRLKQVVLAQKAQ